MADPAVSSATPASPAPAPAASESAAPAVETRSAVDAAVTQTPDKYREAKRAERMGKPLPDVPVEPAEGEDEPASASASAEPHISNRQRKINEAIRVAVAKREQELRDEFAVSARPVAAPVKPAVEPAPAAPAKEPTYKQYLALPDAPKLEAFESIQEYTFAVGEFIADQRAARAAAEAATQATVSRTTEHQQTLVRGFDTRVKALAATDPQIDATIAPVASQIGRATQQSGPVGDIFRTLSEMVLESEVGPQILKHLSTAEGGVTAFVRPPDTILGLPADAAFRAHQRHLITQFRALETTLTPLPDLTASTREAGPRHISAAPDPPQTLGSRPTTTGDPMDRAIKSGDTRKYRELRRAERAAQLGLNRR